jgi:hypothetical protein
MAFAGFAGGRTILLIVRCNLTPQSLNVSGATQPAIYIGTVDDIAAELIADPAKYWQEAMLDDGPITIWIINGERWLSNGNHRYQAAIRVGADIPETQVIIADMTSQAIPTWRFDQMNWLPGRK